jgi:hypothetical protein
MVDSDTLAVCVVLGLASCGPPPRAAPLPPARADAAPPVVRTRATAPATTPATTPAADPDAWSVKGWSWSGGSGLMFVDRGAELLVTNGSALMLVDPRRRIVVDSLDLRSVSIPDRSAPPGQGAKLEQVLYGALWGWDQARDTVVGAVCLGGRGEIAGGLGVWAPGLQELPAPLTAAATQGECHPLAISADGSLFLARTAASTIQLFAVATASPVGAPITLAHDPVAGAIAPDGKWLATGAATGDVELYEPGSGRLETLPRDRNHEIRGLMFDLARPARPVLVVHGDAEVVAWELLGRTPTHLADGIEVSGVSPDGKYLALATREAISIRDGATLQPARSFEVSNTEAIAFSPDATLLAVYTHNSLEIRELGPGGPPAAFDRRWFDQLHPLPVPAPPSEPAFTRDGVVEGRVTAAGRPVAGAEIRLAPIAEERSRARALAAIVTRTGADGRYRLTGVPRIDWGITVSAPGLLRGGGLADLRKRAKATGESKLENAVTIRGLVLGPDGRPVANTHVFHGKTESAPEVEVTSARDGTFTIDHLWRDADTYYGHGGYELQAWRSDGAVATVRTLLKAVGPIHVTLRLAAPEDPHVVRLKIVDENGAAVPDADVQFGNVVHHRSDARGMFVTDAEPGVVQDDQVGVQITVDGYVLDRRIPWPAHGVVTVAIRRTAPPGTLLPLACTLYRNAIERVVPCVRIPRATRDALKSEFDRAAATWAAHPDRAEFDCSLGLQVANDNARLCH